MKIAEFFGNTFYIMDIISLRVMGWGGRGGTLDENEFVECDWIVKQNKSMKYNKIKISSIFLLEKFYIKHFCNFDV